MNIYSLCIKFILFLNLFRKRSNKLKTISLDFGRQTGKTTTIINSYNSNKTLIICNHDANKNFLIQKLLKKYPDNTKFNIVTYNNVKDFSFKLHGLPKTIKTVFVDEASYIHQNKINRNDLYLIMKQHCYKYPLIISLG